MSCGISRGGYTWLDAEHAIGPLTDGPLLNAWPNARPPWRYHRIAESAYALAVPLAVACTWDASQSRGNSGWSSGPTWTYTDMDLYKQFCFGSATDMRPR